MEKKKWWQKLLWHEEHPEKINQTKDISAIIEFLEEIDSDTKKLLPLFNQLAELEKERAVISAKPRLLQINLESQAKVLDKLLENYEFFQNDVDINGIRLKAIANQFLRNARQAGLKDLVQEKKEDQKWKFFW